MLKSWAAITVLLFLNWILKNEKQSEVVCHIPLPTVMFYMLHIHQLFLCLARASPPLRPISS